MPESRLPEASTLPSGLKASDVTVAVWARQEARSRPEVGSQSFTVCGSLVSSLPVARIVPSGEKAADQTSATCPASASGALGASSLQIRGLVPPARISDRSPGRKASAQSLRAPGKRAQTSPVATIPDLRRLRSTRTQVERDGQQVLVGEKARGETRDRSTKARVQDLASSARPVKDGHAARVFHYGHARSPRAETNAGDPSLNVETASISAGFRLPDEDAIPGHSHREEPPIGREVAMEE